MRYRRYKSGSLFVTFSRILFSLILTFVIAEGHDKRTEPEPEFLAQLENLTVTQGRDVSFTCVVNNLEKYRVAWIKSDSKAILAIHTHMVAVNPRLSVTHNGHNTWKLHIAHVQLNDSGSYMCQVNTDPMKSQSGYLDVVVPPDILNPPDLDSTLMEEGVSNEGGTIKLVCSATGVPDPMVQWKRESGKEIILRKDGSNKQAMKIVESDSLVLTNVHRTDMGGYVCIASNGIPPSVSKRFDVYVNFPPTVKAVNELVGAPLGKQVILQCIVEVYPKSLNGWYKNEGSRKIHDTSKYNISETMLNSYTWLMNLTINHLQPSDFGAYICSSTNALGNNDARIRLRELRLPTKSTTISTIIVQTTQKPKRKQISSQNNDLNEVIRVKETPIKNHIQENEYTRSLPEVHTQLPIRNGYEKVRNTQMPAIVPSRRPPWILHSGAYMLDCNIFMTNTITILFIVSFLVSIYNEMAQL